jgi:hypothetical protein
MTHTQLSKLDVDGEVISTAQGILVGAVDVLPTTATEGTVLYDRSSRSFWRFKNEAWTSEDLDIADASLNAESTRPIQNKAVQTAVNDLKSQIGERYTKAEVDGKLKAKQDTITGAAETVITTKLKPGYVLMSDEAGNIDISKTPTANLDDFQTSSAEILSLKAQVATKVETSVFDAYKTTVTSDLSKKANTSEMTEKLGGKQDKFTANTPLKMVGDVLSIDLPDGITVDSALSDTSTNPVQNKVVKGRIDEVETVAQDKYTKIEINNMLTGKQDAGSYVNTDAFNTYKGKVSSTYATKEELKSQASRVLRFKSTVTSDELDAIQDPAIGDVYNLSTDRVFGGKTFKAGTSWVYEYNAADSKAWEPLGGNFEIEALDVDLSSRQPKNIYLTNVKATWTADTTVEGFLFKGKISQATIKADDAATVIFDSAQAMSGNYSSVCNTVTDGIEIWSKTNADITIPCVIIQKGA